jgi:Skp family chaperone for outer membrane proteins
MKALLFLATVCTALSLHAAPPANQPINVDSEVARVKKQLQEIRTSSATKEVKLQKQRALLDREIANTNAKMRDEQTKKGGPKEDSAARDRRKAGVDNLQKLLDILRSMNPQL